jgi:hypothetical protein
MFPIPQSTSFVAVFKAYLSSDHVTEATGKTIAITISKAGGAFGNPNAGATNATEISSGWYKVTLDTTDTATLGILALRGAAATIDDIGDRFFVVSASTGGLTNLDAAISTRLATSGYTAPSNLTAAQIATGVWQDTTAGDFTTALSVGKSIMNGVSLGTGLTVNDITTKSGYSLSGTQTFNVTGNITGNLSGSVGSVTGNVGGNVTGSVGSVTGLTAANLDVAVSTRLAAGSYTAPLDAAGVRSAVGLASANLDTQIDALPTNAELATALAGADDATLAAIAALNNISAAGVKAQADAALADVGMTTTITGRIDDAITSRLASSGYTAPDNSSVTAIKTATDQLIFTKTNELDVNIHSVNGVTVNGDGAGTAWGP